MTDTRSETDRVLAPLHDEHRRLWPHVDDLRLAADAVGERSPHDAFELVDAAWRFVHEVLLVHARREEEVLYPAFTDVLDSPIATSLLSLDHEAITGLTAELGRLHRALADREHVEPSLAHDLRRVLYGLHAIVGAHFQKEEQVVLPTLQGRLDPAAATRLVHHLHGDRHHA